MNASGELSREGDRDGKDVKVWSSAVVLGLAMCRDALEPRFDGLTRTVLECRLVEDADLSELEGMRLGATCCDGSIRSATFDQYEA